MYGNFCMSLSMFLGENQMGKSLMSLPMFGASGRLDFRGQDDGNGLSAFENIAEEESFKHTGRQLQRENCIL